MYLIFERSLTSCRDALGLLEDHTHLLEDTYSVSLQVFRRHLSELSRDYEP